MSLRWPKGYPQSQFNGVPVFRAAGAGDRMAAGRRKENRSFAYLGLKPPKRTGTAPLWQGYRL